MLRIERIKVIFAEIHKIDESRAGLLREREEYLKRIRRNEKIVRAMIATALAPASGRGDALWNSR
jgi:predicted metallopeptidase